MKRNEIDGTGFASEPFTEEERAMIRAMLHHYEREAITADTAWTHAPLAPLKPVAVVVRALPVLSAAAAGMLALGAVARWIHDAGLL